MITRQRGSHRFLKHPDGRSVVFAFHDRETVGPKMVARIGRDLGIDLERFRPLF